MNASCYLVFLLLRMKEARFGDVRTEEVNVIHPVGKLNDEEARKFLRFVSNYYHQVRGINVVPDEKGFVAHFPASENKIIIIKPGEDTPKIIKHSSNLATPGKLEEIKTCHLNPNLPVSYPYEKSLPRIVVRILGPQDLGGVWQMMNGAYDSLFLQPLGNFLQMCHA